MGASIRGGCPDAVRGLVVVVRAGGGGWGGERISDEMNRNTVDSPLVIFSNRTD